MRPHHAKIQGVNYCIPHDERFAEGEDCPECVGEDEAKRAATYCETHDETFESICPSCAMWKANILDQDAQEVVTAPEALDPRVWGLFEDPAAVLAACPPLLSPELKERAKLGDGWVEWKGGACPVEPRATVAIRFREGRTSTTTAPNLLRWDHLTPPEYNEIVAYKVMSDRAETEQSDAEGWVEWNGGACPVGDDVLVDIKRRDGQMFDNMLSRALVWDHEGERHDIFAYLVKGAAMPRPSRPAPPTPSVKTPKSEPPKSALEVQEGGDHYKKLKIQPVEYIHANGLPFAEGSVIKYVTRWRDKNGVADLKKARHFLDLLIELETKATT